MASPSPTHTPPLSFLYFFLISIFIARESMARDLRPSEHGLAFQNPRATPNTSQEMRSFFRGNSFSSSEMALPKAMNTTLPSQWWTRSQHTAATGKDHIRGALLMASFVCGITGAALLTASAFIYIFKFRRQRSSSSLPIDCSVGK